MSDIREQLDKIFTKLIPLDVSEENEVTYHESKPFNSQLDQAEALIQEQVRLARIDELEKYSKMSAIDRGFKLRDRRIKELKDS